MAGNLQLLVKSADLKFKEQIISCSKEWNVSDLKIHVSNLNLIVGKSSAPPKVIFSGRLLMDDEKLENVFKQSSVDDVHTIYLVSSSVQSSSSSFTNLQQQQDEGVRKRNVINPSTNSSSDEPNNMFANQSNFSAHNVHSSPSLVHPVSHVSPPYFFPHSYPSFPAAGADAGGFLMANQAMWMQAYVEYMDQYMKFLQSGHQQTQHQPETLDDAPRNLPNAPDRIAPPPREQRPIQRMNAQGGAFLMDEEEEDQNRDWLDWTYVIIRFSMLMCILYFYTTPSKFIIFIIASLLFFLYQSGWLFLPVFNQRNANNAQRQRVEAGPENNENAMEEAIQNNNNPRTNGVFLQFLYTFWSIFVGLFTSLAPQVPPPVNAN